MRPGRLMLSGAAGLMISIAACEEGGFTGGVTAPTETGPNIVGRWGLTAVLREFEVRDSVAVPTGTTCRQDGVLDITVQRPNGALSWKLSYKTACSRDRPIEGNREYADTWERTAWGWVRGDTVSIDTPWENFLGLDGCSYRGTIRGDPPSELAGQARCTPPACLFCSRVSYSGTWAAFRVGAP